MPSYKVSSIFYSGGHFVHEYEERLVCESGILWRRVLRRFEQRVNEYLIAGWTISEKSGIQEWGFVRSKLLVVLRKEKPPCEKPPA